MRVNIILILIVVCLFFSSCTVRKTGLGSAFSEGSAEPIVSFSPIRECPYHNSWVGCSKQTDSTGNPHLCCTDPVDGVNHCVDTTADENCGGCEIECTSEQLCSKNEDDKYECISRVGCCMFADRCEERDPDECSLEEGYIGGHHGSGCPEEECMEGCCLYDNIAEGYSGCTQNIAYYCDLLDSDEGGSDVITEFYENQDCSDIARCSDGCCFYYDLDSDNSGRCEQMIGVDCDDLAGDGRVKDSEFFPGEDCSDPSCNQETGGLCDVARCYEDYGCCICTARNGYKYGRNSVEHECLPFGSCEFFEGVDCPNRVCSVDAQCDNYNICAEDNKRLVKEWCEIGEDGFGICIEGQVKVCKYGCEDGHMYCNPAPSPAPSGSPIN